MVFHSSNENGDTTLDLTVSVCFPLSLRNVTYMLCFLVSQNEVNELLTIMEMKSRFGLGFLGPITSSV
jgi:hypothetical protein